MCEVASKSFLSDAGVLAEAAHYFCCCRGDAGARGRRWVRLESLQHAIDMAVDSYGAEVPAAFADDFRRARYWAKRARKAYADHGKGLISEEKRVRIVADRDAVASRFGQRVLDAIAFSGRELSCHLHPHHGTWSFERDAVA